MPKAVIDFTDIAAFISIFARKAMLDCGIIGAPLFFPSASSKAKCSAQIRVKALILERGIKWR
jgi:hypothetical protein